MLTMIHRATCSLNGRLALNRLLLLVLCALASSVHAQMAEDGLPWTNASAYGGSFPTTCGPTTSAIECANEDAAYACAQNLAINPQPTSWCGATATSCTVYSIAADLCELDAGGYVEVTTPQPEFFVSTRPLVLADCGSCAIKVSDPISPANGNVSHHETDLPAQASSPRVRSNASTTVLTQATPIWVSVGGIVSVVKLPPIICRLPISSILVRTPGTRGYRTRLKRAPTAGTMSEPPARSGPIPRPATRRARTRTECAH
jgi:hypothetical protein